MTEPRATAARFPADYGQTPEGLAELLTWDEVAAWIEAAPNYLLATVTDDGRPHLRPVDGVFVEHALCFGGSDDTRWVRHLRQRPEASASLPDDDNAVVIEGTVEQVTDPDLPVSVASGPATMAKYPQYFEGDELPPFQPFWCLRPQRIYAWSLSAFPRKATRFDFD